MGGGDLNTKKSWHPSTLKNQERVWKAEQADANEKRRIEDLKREMDNERSKEELIHQGRSFGVLGENSSKKMDWMYKQPHEGVDREQFLLGKKIDKTFEKIVSDEKLSKQPPKNHVEHECIPFSIRNLSGDLTTREYQVDMARKMMEDPLVAIRQRELESRSQLLQNPVKLKELTMLLKSQQSKQKKKKEKKSKKCSKESRDIDKKLAEKLSKLKEVGDKDVNLKDLLSSLKSKKKNSKKKRKCSSGSYSSSEEKQSQQHSHSEHQGAHQETDVHFKTRHETDRYSRSAAREGASLYMVTKQSYNNSSDDDRPRKKHFGLVRADGTQIKQTKSYTESNKKECTHKKVNRKPIERSHRPKELSEAEKGERRRQMMIDASARDKEREGNVSYYKERDRRQEDKEKQLRYEDHFVEKHLRESTKHLSVESRIKSNVYNIQRSSKHMDTHFARR